MRTDLGSYVGHERHDRHENKPTRDQEISPAAPAGLISCSHPDLTQGPERTALHLEQQLSSDLDLPRVEPGARDDAERRRPQLVPGLAPDRTVREVEGLDAKLDVLRPSQV